jgi:hypothetical protein
MSRTVATALPVWIAVAVAVVAVGFTVPSSQWWAALPAIAGGAMIMTFVIQVSLQSKDGLVMRMLVTVTGAIAVLMVASLATLIVTFL